MRLPILSWNDRFALIEAYNPSSDIICKVFNVSPNELKTAYSLKQAGTFSANTKLDIKKYSKLFVSNNQNPDENISDNKESGSSSKTVYKTAKNTAKKQVSIQAGVDANKKGNKIVTAFKAIPTSPVSANEFIEKYGVSAAILRQHTRFAKQFADIKINRVCIRRDKSTNELMIWRE